MALLMAEAKSFLSEHSVEFSLVAAAKELLSGRYEYAVPIYPWMGRELGKLSGLIHGGDCFKVLAIFPRRPKLTTKSSSSIFIRINYELLEFEEVCTKFGIPVVAGCPMVCNFWDLGKSPSIVWLNLATQNEGVLELKGDAKVGMDGDGMLDLVSRAATLSFSDFDGFLRYVKSGSSSFYGPTYKPFYFLIR
ncbi:hypothetical protein [Pseudomonas fluorescens]|uniref:hypothetical protein n=1 Tax=Pseudomonas fluorescens TaxID=294 RepID=UPI003D003357